MKHVLWGTIYLVLTMLLFSSCQKKDTIRQASTKKSPIANAGPDQVFIQAPDSIILDASASIDIDGRIVSYQWSRISGPPVISIANNSASVTTIKSLVPGLIYHGTWEFQLKVTDNDGLTSTDNVVISVEELPPPPPPPSPGDTLGGFIFQDLTWELDSLDMGPPGSVIVVVNPSLFFSIPSMVNRQVQVFIQLDSSPNWIYVPQWDWYGNNNPPPSNSGYVWYFPMYPYSACQVFLIENYPQNFQLVGRPVKVKVKFI